MKITRIRVTPVKMPGSGQQPHVIHSINPIYYYPDLKYDAPPEIRPKQPDGPGSLIVEIETDEGVTGVTQKIVHLAAANDIPVITHGGWVANFHLAMANMNMPMVEYFPDHNLDPDTQVLTGQPRPVDGYITLPDAPGLGLELNRDALKRFAWSG